MKKVTSAARLQRNRETVEALFEKIEQTVARGLARAGKEFIREVAVDVADISRSDPSWLSGGTIEPAAAQYAASLLICQAAWHRLKARRAACDEGQAAEDAQSATP
jgi:hypothetical protein